MSARGLTVSFVESLSAVVEPTVEHLMAPPVADIFEPETIIVPNAGVRFWLLHQIARSLGTGPRGHDGVAANLTVKYLGHLDSLMGRGDADEDPWAVGPLAVGVLSVLNRPGSPFAAHAAKLGGGLKAARALADRFDRYQARRPSMIRQWAMGNPVLEPEVGGTVGETGAIEPSARVLDAADLWQFELWREVHDLIGSPPWPVLVHDVTAAVAAGTPPPGLPSRLLVVGLQSLSVRHLELLSALSRVIDVTVIMVHPSPVLARAWAERFAAVPVTPGVAATQPGADVVGDGRSPLVASWLRGARDAQLVLASQGVPVGVPAVGPVRDHTMLARVQSSIASDSVVRVDHSPGDRSIQIHRAHNLGRQVEIVHEALLHAFNEVPDLEPHEVVILCADIATAAPLLEATFARQYGGDGFAVHVPLVVADRALREVDESASLLVAILEAARSRFSVDHVMAVATNPLVLDHHDVSGDDVATWQRLAEATAVRWGASPEHRRRAGVDLAGYDAHTWAAAIDRALLGAVLPDEAPAPDLGGVVPLLDVESADVEAVTVLSRVVTVLADLERQAASGDRSLEQWADLIEQTLELLASDARGQLEAAFAAVETIRSFARDAGMPAGATAASFSHVADLVIEQVSGAPGRQPLRTGAITATSLVPLRGVPFRVVCLVGFDDGTVPNGDLDGEDLIGRQTFAGDPDARLEYRRAILDAVCSATERVIVTCNGYNIKTNAKVQFITPLAEFVDLCIDCGARWEDEHLGDDRKRASIEHRHPRHFTSRTNFEAGAVVDGVAWSHDEAALNAYKGIVASSVRRRRRARRRAASAPAPLAEGDVVTISPRDLRDFVGNTLHPFVRTGLGINTWIDSADELEAIVPLTVKRSTLRRISESLFHATREGLDANRWLSMQVDTGALPPGAYGVATRRTLTTRNASLDTITRSWGVDVADQRNWPVDLSVDGIRLKGDLSMYRADEGRLATINFGFPEAGAATDAAALDLLILRAIGFDGHIVSLAGRRDDESRFIARHVELNGSVSASAALARVQALLGLYRRAMTVPFPLFGGAAAALDDTDDAEFLFAVSLGADNYVGSLECLVYGALPVFDEVYRPLGDHRKFFGTLFSSLPDADKEAVSGRGNRDARPPHTGDNARRAVFS